jgi:hypothetical protein
MYRSPKCKVAKFSESRNLTVGDEARKRLHLAPFRVSSVANDLNSGRFHQLDTTLPKFLSFKGNCSHFSSLPLVVG